MLVQLLIHVNVLSQLLIRLLTVSLRLLQSAIQSLDLVIPAFFQFSEGPLLLCLEFVDLALQIG